MGTYYRYDESVFDTSESITEEQIEEDFDTYWAKGETPEEDPDVDPEPMTPAELTAKVTEQGEEISLIEDALLEMSEKVYK